MNPVRKSLSWIRTSRFTETDFQSLRAKMQEFRYRDGSGVGFLCEQMTDLRIKGSIVEEKRRYNEIAGPLGHTQKIEWMEFRVVNFTFDRRKSLVETDTTPRNLRLLIQQFGALSEWKASFEPILISPEQFLGFLREQGVRFEVLRLDASDITISSSTSASVEVVGRSSVVTDLESLLGVRHFRISRLNLEMFLASSRFLIELSSSGRFSIEGEDPDKCIAFCRRAFAP